VSVQDCFADEIAIDFPSVDPLVERVRDAFLGEREAPETIAAEVSVSCGEAFHGTKVPLELHLRGTCRACGGRGERWPEPCAACCGTGDAIVRHTVSVSVPPRVPDGATFRFRVSSPHALPVRVEVTVKHKIKNLRI
jgi:DnaJ-class molecular chaperone